MFVKQIFEDFENFENRKKSNLNKTCSCRPIKNGYNLIEKMGMKAEVDSNDD